jgi:hypothetical protein
VNLRETVRYFIELFIHLLQAQMSSPRTPLTPQDSFWTDPMQNWSDGDFDLSDESLGMNGMCTKNLWELINE